MRAIYYILSNWLGKPIARSWIWLSISTALVGTFLAVSSEVREASEGQPELIAEIDRLSIDAVVSLRTPKLNGAAIDITALGSASVLTILVCIVGLFLIFQRKRAHAIHFIVASIGAAPISAIGKLFFERVRPSEVTRLVEVQGYSYPSGHSLAGAAVYFTLAILLCGEVKSQIQKAAILTFFSVLILLIGLSRLYLGVHYFSDIMAGILLGVAWAALVGSMSSFLVNRS